MENDVTAFMRKKVKKSDKKDDKDDKDYKLSKEA